MGIIILQCPDCEKQHKREVGDMVFDPASIPKFMYTRCRKCKRSTRMEFIKIMDRFL